MSSEIRQNKVTKEWVIFASARGDRPHDFRPVQAAQPPQPPHDAGCPFCVGNEHMLPTILAERPAEAPAPWATRVVWNKYPALTPAATPERSDAGIYLHMPGYGHHEVIIENPYHNRDLVDQPLAGVEGVIETYRQRYAALRHDPRNVLILLFRNHGPRAGASLRHPHSQLIAAGIIPRHIRWREDEAQRYFDERGRCVYCDVAAFEAADRQRVVLESDTFISFVPYAAEVPFEIWIVPKRHQADFEQISDAEQADLAQTLHTILGRLRALLNDPDYNYVISTSTRRADDRHLHWYVRLRPRLVTRAGFEIGTGIRINPSLPEADAALLREAALP